jgi:hypothetical protein
MTLARTLKLYKLLDAPATPGLRPMTAADVPQARTSFSRATTSCSCQLTLVSCIALQHPTLNPLPEDRAALPFLARCS